LSSGLDVPNQKKLVDETCPRAVINLESEIELQNITCLVVKVWYIIVTLLCVRFSGGQAAIMNNELCNMKL